MDGAGGTSRWILGRFLLRGLNTQRSCPADASTGCCLIGQPASWSKALWATNPVLTKFEPDKLRLRSFGVRDRARYRVGGSENDGAFLMASLPRQHHCIHEVRVYGRTQVDQISILSSGIAGPAADLQRLGLRLTADISVFSPPVCLHDIDLTNVRVSDALEPKVAEVLRGNGPSLHSVRLLRDQLSPESARTLLLALVTHERLKDLTV
ncbi:hypothetical protein V5799_000650 [Amblyomma americanum]|uniref:Uncharacterized protein n=1 Tax=Amblyomma americanum TaxID=6943 RepID=A0AAQ4D2G0_AMBAM